MSAELVVDALLKVTALFALAWALTFFLRRRSAAVRHLIWAASLSGALAIPALAFVPGWEILPAWRNVTVAAKPASPPPPIVPSGERPVTVSMPTATERPAEEHVASQEPKGVAAARRGIDLAAWLPLTTSLSILWSLGVVFLLRRLLAGVVIVRRILRGARPCDVPAPRSALAYVREALGVRRAVALLACDHQSGPMTWGVFRPVVILPADSAAWSHERLVAVLLHELAHVMRCDCLVQFLCRLSRAVYWFHPLAWLAIHRVHLEQERACDDIVLRQGVQPSSYAEDLVGIAAGLRPVPAAALVSTAIARPSELMARMRYLLDGGQSRRLLSRRVGLAIVLGIVSVASTLGISRPQQAATSPQNQDKQRLAGRLIRLLDLESHRVQAIAELAQLGDAAIPALSQALMDKRKLVVDGAVSALIKSKAKSKAVIPLLIGIVGNPAQGTPVRSKCVDYLAPFVDSDPRVFGSLFAILDESGDAAFSDKVMAIITKSKLFQRGAKKLDLTRDRKTRRPEADVTGERPDESESRTQVERMIHALDGLDPLGGSASRWLRTNRRRAYPHLVQALRDPRINVRNGVMAVLVTPRPVDKLVLPELISLITEKEWKPSFRGSIGRYIGLCLNYDPSGIATVVEVVKREDCAGRRELVQALARVDKHRRQAIDGLAGLLREPGIMSWVVAALGSIGSHDERTAPLLVQALDHRDPNVVAAALRALMSKGESVRLATAKVKALAGNPDPGVQKARKEFLRFIEFKKNLKLTRLLVADYAENRIVEFDMKTGRELFSIDEIFGVWDVEGLANGNLLITEFSVNRVSEMTRTGRVVWQFGDLKNPHDADRLPNGNTLIADTFGRRVIEIDRLGKIVWTYDKNIHPYDADRLPNGNTLISDTHDDRVIEVDRTGKIVWQVKYVPNVHDADRLPNGNTLLTIRMLNEVREIDKNGKTVWSVKHLSSPSDADRLPNGATIVAENGFVRVFSREGHELWKKAITWAVEVNVGGKD